MGTILELENKIGRKKENKNQHRTGGKWKKREREGINETNIIFYLPTLLAFQWIPQALSFLQITVSFIIFLFVINHEIFWWFCNHFVINKNEKVTGKWITFYSRSQKCYPAC